MADLTSHIIVVTAVDINGALIQYTIDSGAALQVVIPSGSDTSLTGIQTQACVAASGWLDAQAVQAALPDYSKILNQPVPASILQAVSNQPVAG